MPSSHEDRHRTANKLSLHDHLMEAMKGREVRYLKAKQISREAGMSNKEVGINMGILAKNSYGPLKVERWGYSKSTTWKVSWR